MRVNIISETEFFSGSKNQGVHTAYFNIVQMLKQRGVEVVVNSKGKADITHLQTIGPLSLYKLLSSRPTVISAHLVPDSFVGSLVLAKYWYWEAKMYLRFFYNRGNLVLAVAPKVRDELVKIGVKKRIEVFPNPIDTKVFHPDQKLRQEGRKLLGLKSEDKVAICVGQVQPRKGTADFLKTAQRLPKVKFVWVGGRPMGKLTSETAGLDKQLAKAPKNFSIFDNIDYSKMPSVYNAADVFFFPSFQENAPMAVIEAAATGLPLLMRDLSEYKLLYPANYLVAEGVGFEKELEKLLADKKYYANWQKQALNLANNFSFATLGDKLVNYYQELLDNR